jgi:protein-S-isoprenylcysteine O-methyltransferase Ste14
MAVCHHLTYGLEFAAADRYSSVLPFHCMSQLRFFYNQRGVLASLPIILAVFITYGETQETVLAWAIGLPFFFLGLFGRIWAQQHLHYRLKMDINLTRTGPYALLRNPIYVSNTLMSIGLTVTSRVLWMVPITILWCALIFSIVVREEESRVVKVFGQPYADYLKDVPRWFPRGTQLPLGLVNEHFGNSIRAELYNLLYLLPFVIKEIVRRY